MYAPNMRAPVLLQTRAQPFGNSARTISPRPYRMVDQRLRCLCTPDEAFLDDPDLLAGLAAGRIITSFNITFCCHGGLRRLKSGFALAALLRTQSGFPPWPIGIALLSGAGDVPPLNGAFEQSIGRSLAGQRAWDDEEHRMTSRVEAHASVLPPSPAGRPAYP